MALPTEIKYGFVTDWVALAEGDGPDTGRDPDARYPDGLTVTFTPKTTALAVTGPIPGRVFPQPVQCTIGNNGYLTDGQGAQGVWLVTGQYEVTYKHPAVPALSFTIEVMDTHTEAMPLYLSRAQPPGGTALTPSEYAELVARIVTLENEENVVPVSSVNGQTGAVTIDAADVGALPDTYTPPAQSWGAITGKPSTFPPAPHTHVEADIADLGNYANASDVTAQLATKADVGDIPEPQTLSLSGTDLTLSDGGGTVSLPSGGGGFVPTMGSAPGSTVTSMAPDTTAWSRTDTWREDRVYVAPAPFYPASGEPVTLSGAVVRINGAVAGASVRVGIYGSDQHGDLDPTVLHAELAIPADTSGNIEAAFAAPVTLAPGIYWVATCLQGGVPAFRPADIRCSVGAVNPGDSLSARSRNGITGALPTTNTNWALAGERDGCAFVIWRVQA